MSRLSALGSRLSALGSMRRAYLNRMLFVRHIRFSYSFGVLRAELLALGTWHLALGARGSEWSVLAQKCAKMCKIHANVILLRVRVSR